MLRLLQNRLVALGIVESICPETVRKTLKKRHQGTCVQYWVIALEENAEFVAAMEEVLEVYARPYDANHSVIRGMTNWRVRGLGEGD